MIKRKMTKKLLKALNNFRIVMLNGPRQSGKTTLVKQIADDKQMSYITLDEPDMLEFAQSDPENFLNYYAKEPLVIDEIQFAPELIAYLKIRVDESNKKGQFLLTGSADFMHMHQITESLAGRMVRYKLLPLANAEIHGKSINIIGKLFQNDSAQVHHKKSLKKVIDAIIQGGYPEILSINQEFRNDWFSSYIESRIQKDIQELKRISLSKLHKIKSLLQLLATYDSQILNYNTIAKKLQISNKTVLSYVELLESMYIIKTVPSYHVNTSLRVIKSPKIHFIDTGLACHLLNVNAQKLFIKKDSLYGGLIENFVFSELYKQSTYCQSRVEIYHFRDLRKKEVDFVLENSEGGIIGIEVKAKATITKKDLKGMLELAKEAKENFINGIIFYGGNKTKPISIDGQLFYCIPLAVLA